QGRQRFARMPEFALAVVLDDDRPARLGPLEKGEPAGKAEAAACGVLPARGDEHGLRARGQVLNPEPLMVDRAGNDGRHAAPHRAWTRRRAQVRRSGASWPNHPGPSSTGAAEASTGAVTGSSGAQALAAGKVDSLRALPGSEAVRAWAARPKPSSGRSGATRV